jgi:hypothetical protein
MATDAAHLAIMKNNGIKNLASNDSDFERVPWIKNYGCLKASVMHLSVQIIKGYSKCQVVSI